MRGRHAGSVLGLVAALASATASVTASCSLVTSLDGLSSGGAPADKDGSVGGDGGLSGADAAGDGAVTRDAGDAGDGGDAAVTSPCGSAPFCDLFERPDVQGSWTYVYTQGGGALAIDPSFSTSPTRSLRVTLPGGNDVRSFVQYSEPAATTRVRTSFSLRTAAPDRTIQIARIELEKQARSALIFVSFLPGKIVLAEQVYENGMEVAYYDVDVVGFVPNTWQRWTIDLTAANAVGATGQAVVTIDGKDAVRGPTKATFVAGSPMVTFGPVFLQDGPARAVHFDDVAIDLRP